MTETFPLERAQAAYERMMSNRLVSGWCSPPETEDDNWQDWRSGGAPDGLPKRELPERSDAL